MYESHFHLSEKPFSLQPDPSFLYLGRGHARALAILRYGLLNLAGFTVVTGEIGCGKTTLIRYVMEELGNSLTVGLISHTYPSFSDLLRWILYSFGEPSDSHDPIALYKTFVEFLAEQQRIGKRTVLIIDEAQNFDAKTLEELRMLSNVNVDKDQLLQMVLVGQPELRKTLNLPQLKQFAQRIAVGYHLKPLDAADVTAYIQHRITQVGGQPGLFTAGACDAVYAYTEGVPRLINVVCDTALVYAFSEEKDAVDKATIEAVIKDRAESISLPGEEDEAEDTSQVEAAQPTRDDAAVEKERRNHGLLRSLFGRDD